MTSLGRRLQILPWAIVIAGLLGPAPMAPALEIAPETAVSAEVVVPEVASGQVFTATETLAVVLPDGTRLVLRKGGAATVEGYSWSAASGTGRIEFRLAPGTYQIAAGRLGPSGDIVARVGASTIRVFEATAIIAVCPDGAVRAYMTAGDRLDVAGAGVVRTIDEPDVEAVVPAQGSPLAPRRVDPEQVAACLAGSTGEGDSVVALGDLSFAGGVETRREPPVPPVDGRPRGPGIDRRGYQLALSYAPGYGVPAADARDVSGEPHTSSDASSAFVTTQTDTIWQFQGTGVARTSQLLERAPGPITNRVIFGDGLTSEIGENNPTLVVDDLDLSSGRYASFSRIETNFRYGFTDGLSDGPGFVLDTDFEPEQGIVLLGLMPRVEGIAVSRPDGEEFGSGFDFAALSALQTGFVSIALNDGIVNPEAPVTVTGKSLTIRNTGTPFDGIRLGNVKLKTGSFILDGSLHNEATGLGFRLTDNFVFQQFDERIRVRRLQTVRARAALIGAHPDKAQAWAALYEDSKRWERFTERNVDAFRRILLSKLNDGQAAQRINLRIDPTGETSLTTSFLVKTVRADASLAQGPINYAELLSALIRPEGTEGISDADVGKLLAALASFEGKGPVTPQDVGLSPSSPELAAFGFGGIAALDSPSNDPWLGKPTGASIVFAAGDVDGAYRAPSSPRVDRFFTSAGLSNFADRRSGAAVAGGIRAFLPIESAFARRGPGRRLRDFGIPLVDSGVLLAYHSGAPIPSAARRGYANGGTIGQLAHADLGIAGSGASQRSTFSITIGQVDRYRVDSKRPGDAGAYDAFLTGHTLGSSRDRVGSDDRRPASTFFSSPQGSTAAGGGNPALVDAKGRRLAGTPGYFVVESFDPLRKDRRLNGGIGRALGQPDEESREAPRFASLRLLSATASLSRTGRTGLKGDFHGIELAQRTPGLDLEGFAAGLSEFETSRGTIGIGFADAFGAGGKGRYAANLSIAARPETNRLTATLRLTDPNGVSKTRVLGGDGNGTSAYFDDRVFAARTEAGARSGAHALVSGQLVTTGKGSATELPGLGKVGTNRHLAWGLFLADRTWKRPAKLREHVHMGAWVAGDPTERNRYREFTGQAEYRGPAIGNTYDGRAVSTVLGSFRNTWDFGKKTGSFDLEFDKRRYTGTTRFKAGRGFVGGALRSKGRIARVDGDFFGPTTGRAGARSPAAIGGQFAISNLPRKQKYRASGVFFGKKCGRC